MLALSRRQNVLRTARRAAVVAAGASLLLAGFVMIFLPAPGMAVMLSGLALLATEFAWARRWLIRGRTLPREVMAAVWRKFARPRKSEAAPCCEAPPSPATEAAPPCLRAA